MPAGPTSVIIATNAAESSITLPGVDHVICLGTHKQLRYNHKHHATQLTNSWVSKASATQRAGPSFALPRVPLSTLLYEKKGTKRVLEYARLAMGFANVRASRYGIREYSGGYSRVLMPVLVLVQAAPAACARVTSTGSGRARC